MIDEKERGRAKGLYPIRQYTDVIFISGQWKLCCTIVITDSILRRSTIRSSVLQTPIMDIELVGRSARFHAPGQITSRIADQRQSVQTTMSSRHVRPSQMDISLVLTLDFMISPYHLAITWRRTRLITSRAHTWSICRSARIVLCWCRSTAPHICLWFRHRRPRIPLPLPALLRPITPSAPSLLVSHIVISHSLIPPSTLLFRIWDDLIVVFALGVLCDDVPCVQEAGEVTQHAEEDV
jgi:hypothetical protein